MYHVSTTVYTMSPRHLQCLENTTISHHMFMTFMWNFQWLSSDSAQSLSGLLDFLLSSFPGEYDNIRIGEAEKGPIRRLNLKRQAEGVIQRMRPRSSPRRAVTGARRIRGDDAPREDGAIGFVTGATAGSLGFFLRTMRVTKGMGALPCSWGPFWGADRHALLVNGREHDCENTPATLICLIRR